MLTAEEAYNLSVVEKENKLINRTEAAIARAVKEGRQQANLDTTGFTLAQKDELYALLTSMGYGYNILCGYRLYINWDIEKKEVAE